MPTRSVARRRAAPRAGRRPCWISAAIRMSSSMRRFSMLSSRRRTFSILAAATFASAVRTRRSSSVNEWECCRRVQVDEADHGVAALPVDANHSGAHIAERMPEARIESSLLKRASSSTFGQQQRDPLVEHAAGDGAADVGERLALPRRARP